MITNLPRSVRLTDKFITGLMVDHRTEFADQLCPGLKLRVSATGAKSFSVKARSSDGKVKTVTLGKYPSLTLKDARNAAKDAIRDLKAGINPTTEKRRRQAPVLHVPTLNVLLDEYQVIAMKKQIGVWMEKRGRKTPEARASINRVFRNLLTSKVTEISDDDFKSALENYKSKKNGKLTANGSASRARAYLMTVLDWASGRNRFKQKGLARALPIETVDMRTVFDPSANDPNIEGIRDRTLTEEELCAVLPLLCYPLHPDLRERLDGGSALGPAAHYFILLTAARLDEVATARWKDFDMENGAWLKHSIKSTNGKHRRQSLPLSDEAVKLLNTLPRPTDPTQLIFPNSAGSVEENWQRITEAIQSVSATSGWTRHDLRRTASTLLELLWVDLGMVGRILGHTAPHKRTEASPAIAHYATAKKIVRHIPDPQKIALDRLSEVYIELLKPQIGKTPAIVSIEP